MEQGHPRHAINLTPQRTRPPQLPLRPKIYEDGPPPQLPTPASVMTRRGNSCFLGLTKGGQACYGYIRHAVRTQ